MGRISRILTTEAAAEPPAEMVDMESDFVVILAALLCALICVVGMIAVARCAWLRRGISSVASRSSSQLTAAANRGVKKKNLQLLPKFTYSAATATTPSSTPAGGMFAKFASTECAICLGEFVEGDEVRVLPQCGHGFHVGCIDTWLGSHSSCPSCRRILVMIRCQKCGQFAGAVPAASSTACGGGAAAPEPELRGTSTGESNNRCDNNNDSVNVSSFLP